MNADLQLAFTLLDEDVTVVWKSPSSPMISSLRTRSLTRLERGIESMADWNTFLVLNRVADGVCSKPRIDQVTSVRYMMLDFDPKEGAREFPYSRLETVFPVDSMHEVQSGRGLQFWLAVNQGDMDVPTAHRVFKVISKEVQAAFSDEPKWLFDTTCADVSRIVRCPGTINHKSGRMATMKAAKKIVVYPLERWSGLIEMPKQREALPNTSWRYLAPRLHPRNLAFLLEGAIAAAESRHGRAFHCAKELFESGVTREEAINLITIAAAKSTPNLMEDDPTCPERLARQIWGRADASFS